jgi:hypothetical protein
LEAKRQTFRLYILGQLGDYTQPLVTFAEFNQSRAVERIVLDKELVAALSQRIRELHEFIETGWPPLEESALTDLGSRMFDLVLRGKVRRLLDLASGQSPQLLPFEIFVEDFIITGWPWEYLYDSERGKFLSQEFHPISRGIFSLSPELPLRPIAHKIRILLVIGVLPGDPNTTPEAEIKWMKEVFKTQLATDSVSFKIMQAVRPEDLDRELQANDYDVFHFFGHARFDVLNKRGYLRFEQPDSEPYLFYANDFARLLTNKEIRLVFLNACESGRTSDNQDPARSSIAAALLENNIPAVIATQFSIADVSAHYLSSMIYNGLVTGKPLIEAMQIGRRAMNYAKNKKFFDWGIPVLYTADPSLVIFPNSQNQASPAWAVEYHRASKDSDLLQSLQQSTSPDSPSVTVGRTALRANKKRAQVRVALIDFDAKVGFLPDLVELANEAQHYYNFEVAYLPIPSSAIKVELTEGNSEPVFPQLYLPLLENYLSTVPQDLNVEKVCCLTRCRISGKLDDGTPFRDYRASTLDSTDDVIALSLFNLREYANQASVSYAKATLFVCLGMVVASDKRWGDPIHNETAGCLFDNCRNRSDIVFGLAKMKFDHAPCRHKIKDQEQLEAIDALLALEIDMNRPGA